MKPEEFINLMLKRSGEFPKSESQKEAFEEIIKISQNLYLDLKHGQLRHLTVLFLKEILSILPDNPTEEDINKTITLIESIILTVITCILDEGQILTMTSIKDMNEKEKDRKIKEND